MSGWSRSQICAAPSTLWRARPNKLVVLTDGAVRVKLGVKTSLQAV